ncbi:MAG TPA: ATP-dependent helicase, partial [Bacteroidales bacterium]|nr:ATP-dependent helicase [Bacteroidales bacterium]
MEDQEGKKDGENVGREIRKAEREELSLRNDLLDNFLSNITRPTGDLTSSDFESTEPDAIDSSAYPEMDVTPAIDRKIKELKTIAESIEKRTAVIPERILDNLSTLKVNYIQSLNTAQLSAVLVTEKPLLVIAGAGSGKTRVIVHKVSYLIEKGVDPQSILLLTFTRKASKEMLDRVQALLHDNRSGNVTGGTFHSFAAFILRKYSNLLNLPSNFTIIDSADSEDVIDLIRTELKYNTKDKKFPAKSRIYDIISYSRNRNTTIASIIHEQYTGLINFIPDIELIYSGYMKYKALSRIFDYDDLMDVLRNSLRDNMRFRESMQRNYSYVMVDEFQDTNVLQKEIVDFIAAKHRRIMVVGDDSQSIYAFRGANYENILRFPETYPDCVVIKIEENYRSNQKILDFTNSIIGNARIGYRKHLFSRNLNQSVP